ncbi:hypothetical protein D3C77_222200 [compost metagenome]
MEYRCTLWSLDVVLRSASILGGIDALIGPVADPRMLRRAAHQHDAVAVLDIPKQRVPLNQACA